MKSFFSKLTKKLSDVAEKSEDTIKSFKEKVEGFDSNPQYRDFKNSIVNPNFSGIKTDLENTISSELALNVKNPFLNDLRDCLHEVNSLLNGESNVDKEDLAIRVFMDLRYFFLYGYLSKNGYLKPLSLKRSQLIYKDDYGDVKIEPWFDEAERFARNHTSDVNYYIEANTTYELRKRYLMYGAHLNFHYENDKFSTLYSDIDSVLDAFIEDENSTTTDDLSLIIDPYEYERAIAEAISNLGAEARATQGSGDQGADVIATYADENYIIQCKLYSKPVGNKAVQEVAAAKQFYEGDYAIVVSNNSFTPSARALANKLNVTLLHHSQLGEVFVNAENNKSIMDTRTLYPQRVLDECIRSEDTEILLKGIKGVLANFEYTQDENQFLVRFTNFDILLSCLASDDQDVFWTYLFRVAETLDFEQFDEVILYTFNDIDEDIVEFALAKGIEIFNDESIVDHLFQLAETNEE